MMEFCCRLTTADIDRLTVSLGMHTVGDEELGTTNDAQMTRRVSRVIMHNGYNTLKTVSVIWKLLFFHGDDSQWEMFHFVPFWPITD